jgi:dolichyl-phosphate beta-glucosyltransferase
LLPDYVQYEAPAATSAVPDYSIVIPAYNEEKRIQPYLEAIAAYFSERDATHEVIVSNDGSKDGTAELIRSLRARMPALNLLTYTPNRGKGHAVRMGMLAARGKIRLFADADGSTPIEELANLTRALDENGSQVAIGSRDVSSKERQVKMKLHRQFIGWVFRMLRWWLTGLNVLDSQCGFKAFTAEAADRVFVLAKMDGFAFDVELLYLARRCGFGISEVPVRWADAGDSRVNLLTEPFKMFLDVCRIRGLHRRTNFG